MQTCRFLHARETRLYVKALRGYISALIWEHMLQRNILGCKKMTWFHGILNGMPQEDELCRKSPSSGLGDVWDFFLWSNTYLSQFVLLIPGSCLYYATFHCWKPSGSIWERKKKKKKVNLLGYKYKSFPESSPSQDVLKSTAVILVFIHFSSSFGPNFLISSVLTEPNWIIQLICSQPFWPEQSGLAWHGLICFDTFKQTETWRSSLSHAKTFGNKMLLLLGTFSESQTHKLKEK